MLLTEIDRQRSLYRFLTKSARKGEAADAGAALARLELSDASELNGVADGMQQRLSEMYPDAPDLRALLAGSPTADQFAALQTYDWVTAGIYGFGLPPTKTRSGTAESSAHRALKEWAAANGEALGAPAGVAGTTERWFPSGDESDAAFIGESDALIVEVRPRGAEPHELRQTLFALVKMRAVLEAEQFLADRTRDGQSGTVRATLVVEDAPSDEVEQLARRLGVGLFVR